MVWEMSTEKQKIFQKRAERGDFYVSVVPIGNMSAKMSQLQGGFNAGTVALRMLWRVD